MKLGFSTIGCPEWTLENVIAAASELRVDGIEVRRIEGEVYAPKIEHFQPDSIGATMRRMSEAGLEFPLIASSAVLGKEDRTESSLREIDEYVALAKKIGARYVRLLIGSRYDDESCDLDLALDAYREMCRRAENAGVSLLIETNSVFSDTAALADFLDKTGSPASGALWDMNYPFRLRGEMPETTVKNLGDRIKYVHAKDSVYEGKEIKYRMMGNGDLPIFDVLTNLSGIGYDGYLSFEWITRWSGELAEPEAVLYKSIEYMRSMLSML